LNAQIWGKFPKKKASEGIKSVFKIPLPGYKRKILSYIALHFFIVTALLRLQNAPYLK